MGFIAMSDADFSSQTKQINILLDNFCFPEKAANIVLSKMISVLRSTHSKLYSRCAKKREQ
jgi:hypothetical protein